MLSVQIATLVAVVAGGGDTVLLDFHAPWCAPCRSMEGTVADLERAGYPVRRVNIDNERKLAVQHNVQTIPCFVLLVDGREVARETGAVRRDQLVELFAKGRVRPRTAGPAALAQSPDSPSPSAVPSRDAAPFQPEVRGAPPSVDPFAAPRMGAAAMTVPAVPPVAAAPHDLIASSVRLTVADPQGFSKGSGTIIDARQGEALVLTCAHIFRDSGGKGEITIDLLAPGGPEKIPGRLIKYDLKSDLALVSLRPGVPVRTAPVARKGHRLSRGDRVTTVGCNNGGPPTALPSQITAVDKFLGPSNVQVAGLPVEGRSGGGLFSHEGHVIGVCNAADPTDKEGLYAALPAIHSHLDEVGLSMVYQQRPDHHAPPVQLASLPHMPGPAAEVGMPGGAGLGAAGRTAVAELERGADGAEVICIVRTLGNPQARSEVIKLDRASAAFLQQLAADHRAQEARHLTSVRGRNPRAPSPRAQQDTSTREGRAYQR